MQAPDEKLKRKKKKRKGKEGDAEEFPENGFSIAYTDTPARAALSGVILSAVAASTYQRVLSGSSFDLKSEVAEAYR